MERLDKNLGFMLKFENVAWYEGGIVKILDRRIYPIEVKYAVCENHVEVAKAIKDMVTQSGGPYAAAEMGMVQAANEAKDLGGIEFIDYMKKAAVTLSTARPTTSASMSKVTDACLTAILKAHEEGKNVVEEGFRFALENINNRYSRANDVAKHLIPLIPENGTVMTQCFAEFYIGMILDQCLRQGKDIKVICPETRPYFQGARLTASVARDMGFDVSVITDNMPAYILKNKNVDLFTSAADAVCLDGHIVNKIGTFQIALAAHYWGVPFYVTGNPEADYPTIDSVKIEERDASLVTESMGQRIAMEGVKGIYPAFDITPPKFISGIVTQKGIYSPYNLKQFFSDETGWKVGWKAVDNGGNLSC